MRIPRGICFVCCEYPPARHGGIGTFTRVLGRALARAGCRVQVVGIHPDAPREWTRETDQGVEVWRRDASPRRGGWLLDRMRLFGQVRAIARKGEVDVIEIPDWQGLAALWPRLPVPVVARLHGSATFFATELGRQVKPLDRRLERLSASRLDAWCAVTRYVARQSKPLLGLRGEPGAILFNGVESLPDGATGTRANRQVVYTGTLTAKKGVISLVEAWPLVLREVPDAELHLFGKDTVSSSGRSMQSELMNRLDSRQRSRVFFHGHAPRETLFSALRTARVGVFPSFMEACPFAPIEAMACGCPTIHSRLGPGPEIIDDGRTGLLIDPNHPSEIAAAILRVLRDEALAHHLSVNGAQEARARFSMENLVSANLDFYGACISQFEASRKNPGRSSQGIRQTERSRESGVGLNSSGSAAGSPGVK